MKLSIRAVQGAGNLEKERVVLFASADVDVGWFIVAKTRKLESGNVAGGKLSSSYWIPDKDVKANDLVVIYTKTGEQSEKENKDGSKSHFFYWGLPKSQWEEPASPVIFEIERWKRLGSQSDEA